MIPVLSPGDVGVMTAAAVRDLASRAIGDKPIATYVEERPMAWSVIEQGGWDLVGVPGSEGGGDASLVDLVTVARVWGESCIPLPFIVSLMTKRWSAEAREHSAPVTLAVANVSAPAAGRIPFGRAENVRVLRSVTGGTAAVDVSAGDEDAYAVSLPTVDSPWVSDLAPEAAVEMAVVWAAEATGCAQRLLDLSVAHARERHQFDKPIGSFQSVKHTLASMKVLTETSETAVLWAAVEPSDAARAARWALDHSVTVAERAIHVHGGMGFTWEMGLHYYMRHILTLRELVGGLST
jgi:alkylation response protein AidB-like acyl-CoA dehydrogenase